MANLEQEQQSRKELLALLNDFSTIRAADLVRDKDLGPSLNFESGVIFFSRTLRLLNSLSEQGLEDLPNEALRQVIDVARPQLEIFRQIQAFSLSNNPNNPIAVRDQLIGQIRDNYDAVFRIVAPLVAFAIRKGTDFARLEEDAKARVQNIDSITRSYEDALKKSQQDATVMLEEVRRVAAEAGVSQHSIHFKNEADQHERSAKNWLWATVLIAISTVAIGALMVSIYFRSVHAMSAEQIVQLTVSKVVIVFIFFTATFWCGRTYRAHRHNAVVNRHRQNALSTFQAFVKAAVDEQTKDAVLLQATQCIFAPQQTGYVSGESEVGSVPQVMEIIRSFGSKS